MFFDRIARRRSAAAVKSAARQAVVEAVEPRQHMDGSFGTAVALGAVNGLVVKLDKVNTTDNKNDYYKFTLAQAGRLRVTLDGSTGDADLYLYNGASLGNEIGSSTNGNVTEVIDKANVPAGTYYARVNGQGAGTTNYTFAVQTDFAGQTPGTARVVGSVGTTEKVLKDFIGNTDKEDWYKFTAGANGVLNAKLDGLTSDVDLQLYASDGTTLLKKSINGGATPELIYHGTTAGATYYARVFQYSSTSNYTLHLTNKAIPADGAGNTLAAAKNLNTLGGTATFNDWIVNKHDEVDLYKFFVAEQGNITVKLTGLSADLTVELLDFNGNVTASAPAAGKTDETIVKMSNFGGQYYVRVRQGGTVGAVGDASPYSLSITAPKDAGPNTRATAKLLPLVNNSATTTGFVGVNDKEDWFKVNVVAGKTLKGSLFGLSADADLELYNSAGTLLTKSTNGGTTSDNVSYAVTTGGDYFFRILNYKTNNAAYTFKATVV
ncbi:MAG TPA: PPC domain-containing protein [Humisphaera sp.]